MCFLTNFRAEVVILVLSKEGLVFQMGKSKPWKPAGGQSEGCEQTPTWHRGLFFGNTLLLYSVALFYLVNDSSNHWPIKTKAQGSSSLSSSLICFLVPTATLQAVVISPWDGISFLLLSSYVNSMYPSGCSSASSLKLCLELFKGRNCNLFWPQCLTRCLLFFQYMSMFISSFELL